MMLVKCLKRKTYMKKLLTFALLSTAMLHPETAMAGSVKKMTSMWEQKAHEKEPAKELPAVGNDLGRITKQCETDTRKEHYGKIKNECEAVRNDPKKFDIFFKKYLKAAPKISGLRDLGTYDPDPAKSQQKELTKADMRTKGTPIGTLDKHATCAKFAEHMSLVHPGNNDVFEATMKCVANTRNVAKK